MSTEIILGFTAAGVTLLGIAVAAFFGLLNVIRSENRGSRAEAKEDNARLREEMREDNARLREDNARLREDNVRLREEIREDNARLREDNVRLREEMREDNARLREDNVRLREELLAEIREGNRRILEALCYHRHEPDGTAVFYPPQAQAAD